MTFLDVPSPRPSGERERVRGSTARFFLFLFTLMRSFQINKAVRDPYFSAKLLENFGAVSGVSETAGESNHRSGDQRSSGISST